MGGGGGRYRFRLLARATVGINTTRCVAYFSCELVDRRSIRLLSLRTGTNRTSKDLRTHAEGIERSERCRSGRVGQLARGMSARVRRRGLGPGIGPRRVTEFDSAGRPKSGSVYSSVCADVRPKKKCKTNSIRLNDNSDNL